MGDKNKKIDVDLLNETLSRWNGVFEQIDMRLTHLEDATLDNRDVLIKLVKQSNKVVEFLQSMEITEEYQIPDFSDLQDLKSNVEKNQSIEGSDGSNKIQSLRELIDEFMSQHKELKEFEKELKKIQKDITPGQIGEA